MVDLTDLGQTERLWLRAPSADDIPSILALWQDAEVTRHIGGPRDPRPVEDHFQRYVVDPQHMAAEERDWWWSIVELGTKRFVGLGSLSEKDVDGQVDLELGYFLLPAHWRKGYASEASRRVVQFGFSQLGRSSLIAIIDPHNAASLAVARRLGMSYERTALRPDGVARDVYRLWAPGPTPPASTSAG
jgi:ribosomal-protein-alanine N-acetyltransferase